MEWWEEGTLKANLKGDVLQCKAHIHQTKRPSLLVYLIPPQSTFHNFQRTLAPGIRPISVYYMIAIFPTVNCVSILLFKSHPSHSFITWKYHSSKIATPWQLEDLGSRPRIFFARGSSYGFTMISPSQLPVSSTSL